MTRTSTYSRLKHSGHRLRERLSRQSGSRSRSSHHPEAKDFKFQPVPEDWKVANKDSENGAFKELMELLPKRHYKDARVIYTTKKAVCIEMEHPSRSIRIEGKYHHDIKYVVEKMISEVKFKEAGTRDRRFATLYRKLHENSDESLNDSEAKVFYKEESDRTVVLKVEHKTRSWSVKEQGLDQAIKVMKKHLEYLETPEIKDKKWNSIFNEVIPNFYPKSKVFHKILIDASGRKRYTIKLAHPHHVEIHKEEGDDFRSASSEFIKWLNDHKQEYGKKLARHKSYPPVELKEEHWSKISERNLHDGKFRELLDTSSDLKHDAKFYYCKNATVGWKVKCVKEPAEVITGSGYTLDIAIDKVLSSIIQFIEVDIYQDKEYEPLRKKFDDLNNSYREGSKKNLKNAKVYYKKDTSKKHATKTIHVIKGCHPFWGFSKFSGKKEKAITKMAEHLTFLPVNEGTFESLFGRRYNEMGKEWKNLFEAKAHYAQSKLFYKKDEDNWHTLKVDDPLEGEISSSKKEGPDALPAVIDLCKQLQENRSKKGRGHVFHHSIHDANIGHFKEIEVTDETENGAFDTLLKDLEKYCISRKVSTKVFYSRDDLGFKVSIRFIDENGSVSRILREIGHSLNAAIDKARYNFDYTEVNNDDKEFKEIFNMLKDQTEFKILKKEDNSNLFHEPPCWLVKVEHSELGFQVHGKNLEEAIKNMVNHLQYKKITKTNPQGKSNAWEKIFAVMPSYGNCGLFYIKRSPKLHELKVDHPDWGIQFQKKRETPDKAAEEISKLLIQHETDAKENFIFDSITLMPENKDMEERLHESRFLEANAEVEKKVFKPLFKVLKKVLGEKEAKKANIYYTKKPKAIKVVYKNHFYELKNSARGFEYLVKEITPVLEFKEAARDDAKFDELYKKLNKYISQYADQDNESAKKVKIYHREFKVDEKNKISLDVDINEKWKEKDDKHERREKKTAKSGHVVKVDHPIFGFAKYDETFDGAIQRLIEHYNYREVTEDNFRDLHDFNSKTMWEKIFEIKNKAYGGCRIYYKWNHDKKKTTGVTLKVDHEVRGLQYEVDEETPDKAAEKLHGLLDSDEAARKNDFIWESNTVVLGKKKPDAELRVWKDRST